MGVPMEKKVAAGSFPRWYMDQAQTDPKETQVQRLGPVGLGITIPLYPAQARRKGPEQIQDGFGANIAQMPNFVSPGELLQNNTGQPVMRIGQNPYPQRLREQRNLGHGVFVSGP